jgi:hypothetical protein
LVSRDTSDTIDTIAIPKIISYKKRIGIAGIAAIHQYYSNIVDIILILFHDQSSVSDMFY